MDSRRPDDKQRRFETSLRGYDTQQVDEYVAELESTIRELQNELKASAVRTQALHKKLTAPRDAEEEIGAAYLAAAEAKQRLLDDARQKAEGIIAAAEEQARKLAGTDTARRVSDAEGEAKRILHEAHAESERLMARTRTEALAAVAAAQREVETLLARNRDRHLRFVGDLRALKEAVDQAVEKADRDSSVFETAEVHEPSAAEA